MTARGPRLFLSAVVAVAIVLPTLRIALATHTLAGGRSALHRPVQQQRVPPVATVRGAQAWMARLSTLNELSRRSRASQPLLHFAALNSTGGTKTCRLFFPLRC